MSVEAKCLFTIMIVRIDLVLRFSKHTQPSLISIRRSLHSFFLEAYAGTNNASSCDLLEPNFHPHRLGVSAKQVARF